MVAASTLADPARAARSFWRLHGAWGNRSVQRMVASARGIDADGDRMRHVERAIEDGRGGGQPLDYGVQAQVGSALAADFSGVRVHADAHANGLSSSLKARAFTVGQDVYFGHGEYDPGSSRGRHLLAHELTHVVQQNPDRVQTMPDEKVSRAGGACGAPAPPWQAKLSVSEPSDQDELEADRVASAVMQREQAGRASSRIGHDAAPDIHTGSHGRVQRVGECAGKSKDSCSGSCVHTSGNPGTCRWSGTITYGCVCYENPKLSPVKQVLYDLIMAALIAAGIILTVAAIAAIVACLSGPCEVAALIAALGYAGAMIILGIIRSGGGDTSSEASTTEAAGDEVPGEEALA